MAKFKLLSNIRLLLLIFSLYNFILLANCDVLRKNNNNNSARAATAAAAATGGEEYDDNYRVEKRQDNKHEKSSELLWSMSALSSSRRIRRRRSSNNSKLDQATKQSLNESRAHHQHDQLIARKVQEKQAGAEQSSAERLSKTTTTTTAKTTTTNPESAQTLVRVKRARRLPNRVQLAQRPKPTTTTTSTTTTSTTSTTTPTSSTNSAPQKGTEDDDEQEEGEETEEETDDASWSESRLPVVDNKSKSKQKSVVDANDDDNESTSPTTSESPPTSSSTSKAAPTLSKNSKSAGKQLDTVAKQTASSTTTTVAADGSNKNKLAKAGKSNADSGRVLKGNGKKTTSSSSSSSENSMSEKEVDKNREAINNMDNITALIKSKKKNPLLAFPFIKPKNDTICIKEAYLEFPHDLIGNKWRARGFVIIHIAVVCYMFYSLALVCERYFMPSLEEFAQRLQLSEDVAGATLMSAGSSAPELFTAILGVFIAKGDVGTGAIVGSAVFNILFVIGVCAFVSTTTAQLDWWPVLRDSVFYTFTVLVLILFIYDERVTAFESFSMIALYGLYILIMVHNDWVRDQVTQKLLMHPLTAKLISSAASVDGADDVFGSCSSGSAASRGFLGAASGKQKNYQTTSMTSHQYQAGNKTVEDDSMYLAACLIIVQHKRLFRSQLRFQSAARYIIVKRQHRMQMKSNLKLSPAAMTIKGSNEVNYFGPESDETSPKTTTDLQHRTRIEAYTKSANLSKTKFSIVSKDDYEFWNRPPEEGENYYLWMAKIPVNYVLHYTTPDCALYPDKYMFTFFISIAWTAFFSYIMVWMVTLIGFTLGIPDSVMGFTFLAAGTSIPDCYSSIHAARNGMANMAVSNSIGSNVFDILIGLSLPWFIQTAIYPGVIATINSRGVIYSVILLFLSLIVTIYLMNQYEWTLKPRLGLALLIAYGLFIVLTCMLEFNLFGHVNPPPCPVL